MENGITLLCYQLGTRVSSSIKFLRDKVPSVDFPTEVQNNTVIMGDLRIKLFPKSTDIHSDIGDSKSRRDNSP